MEEPCSQCMHSKMGSHPKLCSHCLAVQSSKFCMLLDARYRLLVDELLQISLFKADREKCGVHARRAFRQLEYVLPIPRYLDPTGGADPRSIRCPSCNAERGGNLLCNNPDCRSPPKHGYFVMGSRVYGSVSLSLADMARSDFDRPILVLLDRCFDGLSTAALVDVRMGVMGENTLKI